MQFRDVKAGFSLFLFDREKAEMRDAKVLDVSPVHYDGTLGVSDMVIDIGVEGFQKKLTFNERAESGTIGNLVISTTRDVIIKEVEHSLEQVELALSQRDSMLEKRDRYKKILSDFSPKYKKDQEIDARFVKIEKSLNELSGLGAKMDELLKELKG